MTSVRAGEERCSIDRMTHQPLTRDSGDGTLAFRRIHGCGNDYVFVRGEDLARRDPSRLAIALSDRHFGVGGDGLIAVDAAPAPDDADLGMRMWNADGSESGMCGNGLRGALLFAVEEGLIAPAAGDRLRVRVGSRLVTASLAAHERGRAEVEIDMGPPVVESRRVPVAWGGIDPSERLLGEPITRLRGCGVPDGAWRVLASLVERWSAVSMGNPHLVLEVEESSLATIDLPVLGAALEHAAGFPERINVHVVAALGPDAFRMATWERGSGITLACGSGACASFAALRATGRVAGRAVARLPGGELRLREGDGGSILMRGEAVETCRGTTRPESLPARPRGDVGCRVVEVVGAGS